MWSVALQTSRKESRRMKDHCVYTTCTATGDGPSAAVKRLV